MTTLALLQKDTNVYTLRDLQSGNKSDMSIAEFCALFGDMILTMTDDACVIISGECGSVIVTDDVAYQISSWMHYNVFSPIKTGSPVTSGYRHCPYGADSPLSSRNCSPVGSRDSVEMDLMDDMPLPPPPPPTPLEMVTGETDYLYETGDVVPYGRTDISFVPKLGIETCLFVGQLPFFVDVPTIAWIVRVITGVYVTGVRIISKPGHRPLGCAHIYCHPRDVQHILSRTGTAMCMYDGLVRVMPGTMIAPDRARPKYPVTIEMQMSKKYQ